MNYIAKLTEVKTIETRPTCEYVKTFIEEKLGQGVNDDDIIEFDDNSTACYYEGLIDIDEIIRKLNVLKQDCGITHVEVFHHTDHGCYEISGFNLEVREETDLDTEKRRFEEDKEKKIKFLQEELGRVKRSTYYNPTGAVEVDDDDLPF